MEARNNSDLPNLWTTMIKKQKTNNKDLEKLAGHVENKQNKYLISKSLNKILCFPHTGHIHCSECLNSIITGENSRHTIYLFWFFSGPLGGCALSYMAGTFSHLWGTIIQKWQKIVLCLQDKLSFKSLLYLSLVSSVEKPQKKGRIIKYLLCRIYMKIK